MFQIEKPPFSPTGSFKAHDGLDEYYTVEPTKRWQNMMRYNSFVLNSIKYYRDDFVYVANESTVNLVLQFQINSGCAFYDRSPMVNAHKLKRCSHRDEAGEVNPWLEMFRHYRARGGGPGARCSHCRFPIMLCWRTVYREKMDLKYGSATEARESEDHFWY
ncbi:hypothetical protein FOCG_16715 [Fusarium oxysporum f. sp. radicis-lycopersici 26381]|nr:hypothetical protein FOCG_16715 [Fusarium oxysporum f. sp. radicis-lycopersici 26381]